MRKVQRIKLKVSIYFGYSIPADIAIINRVTGKFCEQIMLSSYIIHLALIGCIQPKIFNLIVIAVEGIKMMKIGYIQAGEIIVPKDDDPSADTRYIFQAG